jgi:hypothetical protein
MIIAPLVNANSLLTALGVPSAKHDEYLSIPSKWQVEHHLVPTTSECGVPHSPGVSGTWIHFDEATELAKRLGLKEGDSLATILREDLFKLVCLLVFPPIHHVLILVSQFAALASLKDSHSPMPHFGLPVSLLLR